jgi:WD40 repeat protein
LASGHADGTIRLWDVTDPAHPRQIGPTLPGGPGGSAVDSVAFGRDGHMLASGTSVGTIWLWKVTNPEFPVKLDPIGGDSTVPVQSVAFSRDGHTLASGSADGTIRLWNLSVQSAINRICAVAGGLTPRQWNEYIRQLPYRATCVH